MNADDRPATAVDTDSVANESRRRSLSLAQRFLLVNLVIVVLASVAISAWVGVQIKQGVLDRTAAVTALYIESFIEPHVQTLSEQPRLDASDITSLRTLLNGTELGQDVVSFRVWSSSGEVLYSPVPSLVGRKFPAEDRLEKAFAGQVTADLSDLSGEENEFERTHWKQLVEMYVPVRARGSGHIIAVAEFYELPTGLQNEISRAQLRSWAIVALVAVASYLLLFGLVQRASRTIERQDEKLREQVAVLSGLLEQNSRLHNRMSRAASRSMALHAEERRRTSSDLHDGPAQDLALAMLRLDSLEQSIPAESEAGGRDLGVVRRAVGDALQETRDIAAGLRVPELADLTLEEVVRRAVRDNTAHGGAEAWVEFDGTTANAPLPVRIALFRCLQEALSNASRHAPGARVFVRVRVEGNELLTEVVDDGPGFDAATEIDATHLGLAGMRERAELLGGTFAINGTPGQGTRVVMTWPLPAGRPE
jgi:signal transduction histidine kinase